MSAKRMSSTTVKHGKASNSWTEAIEAININDENWNCMITMIVETLPEHVIYVNLLEAAAQRGLRKAIHSLTFLKMMQSVRTLSKIEQDKCPVAQTVFHYANKLIGRGESLEASLVAALVKYLVYLAKIDSIARSKKDLESDVDRELRALLTTEKVESQRSLKSVKTKKSEQRADVSTEKAEKASARLRKRGEEWKDKVYIDDAPEDGPDLFIFMTGFRDPEVVVELIKAGLPLTCILKIKRPGESLTCPNDDRENSMKKVSQSFDATLFNFWAVLDKSANDPENLELYSTLIFQTFCPPEIGINGGEEEEASARDLYDRVSRIVYDLHDLQRLHVDYIRSMKLQHVPREEPRMEFDVYTKIMNSLPSECAFVTVILQAMLAQVEFDLRGDRTSDSSNGKSVSNPRLVENAMIDRSKNRRQRIHQLNLQHGIKLNENGSEDNQTDEAKIIFAGDNLRLKTHHVHLQDDVVKFINPKPSMLSDFATRSLRDTRIVDLWRNFEEQDEAERSKYRCHINKIARCFGDGIDSRRLVHYLHLQVFDKMINGGLNRTATRGEDRRVAITEKGAVPASTRSDPFLLSSKILRADPTFASGENPISNLRCFASDSIIDYDKSAGDTFECPELFSLTDTREMLERGFLEAREEELCSSEVAEFTDVRLLPSHVFLQAINDCLEKFEGEFESKYLKTTDTMLLCFATDVHGTRDERDKVFRQGRHRYHRISRIVTPICLRNFCEHIIREESEWIREMGIERAAKRSLSAGELTRKLSQHSDIDVAKIKTFTDDDFILPNSLKAQLRKITVNEENLPSVVDLTSKNSKAKQEKSPTSKSLKEKSKKEAKTVGIDANLLQMRKTPSLRYARDNNYHKIIGYDLGSFRIQVDNETETFVSSDGTVVKINIDQWIYREKRLGIGISAAGCYLKLESVVGNFRSKENDDLPFHLITENGIVMAFCKAQNLRAENFAPPDDEASCCNVRFDFCASWPSGLVVSLVVGDSSENPFYILQKYISKGPECGSVSAENYRKFLRNGTVLAFHDDDTVQVLRPNGTIVRCTNFEKSARTSTELENDGNLTKEEISKSKKLKSSISTRTRRKASSPRKRFLNAASLDDKNGETHSPREQAAGAKITRYTTLEHDGRHYETANDELSRVFDKSLVRTSTDFEVSEKFTRREDGTQSVLNFKGEFIVSFPDGTRIASGFLIEDKPLVCDWSDDEFDKFFLKNNRKPKPNDDARSTSQSSDASSMASNRSSTHRPGSWQQEDRIAILLADAFVSVLMTCRMEHQCYASVAYDQFRKSCELAMPGGVVVAISREGFFDIKIGSNIGIRVCEENLTLSSKLSNDNQQSSETIYNFPRLEVNPAEESNLLVTTDSSGNVFTVRGNGSAIRSGNSTDSAKTSFHKVGRLFAMKRDLSAYEYLHKSQRNDFYRRMNCDARSNVISIPVGRAADLEYRLFLSPLEPSNYSKAWLCEVTKVDRTNDDRTDLSRSTYSNPYEWIFPFGRNGNGVRKNTWKVCLDEPAEEARPRVLTLTLFQGIAEEGKNLLIELQKALACYWRSVIKGSYKPKREICSLLLEEAERSSEEKIDKWLVDLALGIKNNIDTRKYLSGVSTNRMGGASSGVYEVPGRAKLDKQSSLVKAEIPWYEKCMRERIILPYFNNIRGVCFHWIMSCADEALESVEKY